MKHIFIPALLIFLTAGCGPSLETLVTQTRVWAGLPERLNHLGKIKDLPLQLKET